jgi:transglutaminase-like putative cysteine protease
MHLRHVAAGCCALSAAVHASVGDPLDLQVRFPRYYATIVLDGDGRATETREWSRVILKEAALASSRSASVTYSTSAQTGEIVTAYTLKADGRRIDVPKDNYQLVINRGNGKDSPVYSDQTTLSVVFPDVAVGDMEVFSYRVGETEPLFPGKYSTAETFSSEIAYDDVRMRIDYPESLAASYDSHGMEQIAGAADGGRRTVEWRYANPTPAKSERQDWSVIDMDRETHYSFSTFSSYADISGAYGARAAPKAEVTERVQTLANQIAGKAATPKEQAHALYDWVATNISYAGNCIGIGAVVPRDLSFVMDNRIGDCKDHATLLQALLAARGIRSTQALINSGSIYRLPKVPVVSTVNHVINYIPSLDLYADSTSNSTPFGRLPSGDQGKPVLLVDGYREDSRTPVQLPDGEGETTRSVLTVAADGSVAGTTDVFQKGEHAASTRAWARRLNRNREKDMVRDMFRQRSQIGDGTFTKDDPTALSDSYHFKLDYTSEKFIKLPGAGAFYLAPPLSGGSVQGQLQFTDEPEKDADVTCRGGIARDEYVVHFPTGLRILSIPDDVRSANRYLAYEATYRLKGNVLTVTRVLDDKTAGNVCSPKVAADYKKIGDGVLDDLRSQVLYKLPKAGRPR